MSTAAVRSWGAEPGTVKRPADSPWYAALVHPACLVSAVVLVVNDHYLKAHYPNWLTGKLSDVAFMILSPLWLYTAWLGWTRLRGSTAGSVGRRRALGLAIALIGVTFTLMQTTMFGDAAFRWGLGALQYPLRVLWGFATSGEWASLSPVSATMDLTDLCCLPVLYWTWRLAAPPKPQAARPHVERGGV